MVHLSAIPERPKAKAESSDASNSKPKAHLELANYADEFTTSVYGSKYAQEELPRTEMPESPMPRDVAYRMIKDDLSLDNNPMLKYVCNLPVFF